MERSCAAKQRATDASAEHPEIDVDRSRRDALKTFGRYATAAPTAMLLLSPREGRAQKAKAKAKAKAKGRDDDYQ